MSADLYICETTDGVEYYYECFVSFESAILMGALYQLYKVVEPLVRATIQWTEQEVMTSPCYLSFYCRRYT